MSARLLAALALCAGCFRDPEVASLDAGAPDVARDDGATDAVDGAVAPVDATAADASANDVPDVVMATDVLAPQDVLDVLKPTEAAVDGATSDDAALDVTAADHVDVAPTFDATNGRDASNPPDATPFDAPPRARRGAALALNSGAASMQSTSFRLSLEVRVEALPEGRTSAAGRSLRLGTQFSP